MTDRQIATVLGRSLESVRSQRQRLLGPRWASPSERWIGNGGSRLEDEIVKEYLSGASQSLLSNKYQVEWSKLRQVLLSHGVDIRDKSQQAFIRKYGQNPRITPGLGASKLYVILAMFGDGLRPTNQTRRNTHIIGIAAGKDRDFAENWIINFEREYSARPNLKTLGPNNIQAAISSTAIWNDLHRYATFGTRSWGLSDAAFQQLMSEKVSVDTLGYGLKGIFDAEGSVKYEVKRASRQITLFSVNRKGLGQISVLLHRLRLAHSVYKDSIAIFGRRNLVDYQTKIGFSIRRKSEALINMISSFQ